MRILVVSEVFWPEEFIINDLVKEWIKKGHNVEVLTQYPSYPQGYVFQGYNNRGYSIQDWNGVKIHRFHFIEGYRDSRIRKFLNYLWFILNGERVVSNLDKNYDCIFVSQTGPLTVAFPAICIRTSTERPEALDKGCFILAGINEHDLLQAVDTAVEMVKEGDNGIPVPNYTDENVSTKVVKLIQSYTGVVNKMVWRKE